jgi:hypothetical protein
MAMSVGGDGLGTTVQSYGTSFRQYHWHTLARVESFQRLLHEVALLRRARCLCREHSDSKFGSSFKEVVTAANPASGVSSIQGSEMSTDELLQLKTECYKWWRLVREDFDRCAERCPHGMPIESCVDDQCARLVLAASNAELVECDAQVRREREASGLSNDMLLGHIGASVAGVELDMQDFAMAAFHLVYRAILLRAPARPVVPKIYKPIAVRLVNPIDPLLEEEETARRREAKSKARNSGLKLVIGVPCRPLYAHLHLRAAQYSLQRRLAQGFIMVQGGSRSRCFHLLAPNSTNYILSLSLSLSPPLSHYSGWTNGHRTGQVHGRARAKLHRPRPLSAAAGAGARSPGVREDTLAGALQPPLGSLQLRARPSAPPHVVEIRLALLLGASPLSSFGILACPFPRGIVWIESTLDSAFS